MFIKQWLWLSGPFDHTPYPSSYAYKNENLALLPNPGVR